MNMQAPPVPNPRATGVQAPPPVPGARQTGRMSVPATATRTGMGMQAPTATRTGMSMQAPALAEAPAVLPSVPAHDTAGGQSSGIAMHDYLETLNVLVAVMENARGELRGHSVGVARICRRMCERLGLQPEASDAILVAAYLHDIGKTSAYHLTALNVAEYDAHRTQARKSYLMPARVFESVRLPPDVSKILSHLYERYDGQGFPDRLSGKEIPLGSRVLAIVETFADLTAHDGNPFRKKLSRQEAWEVLAKFKGKIFDAGLVDVFKTVVLGDDLRAKLLSDSRRALIVDSDAEETTVLDLRLAEHGFQVTIARNAQDAMNELTQEFDVVISEVETTPFDGFALLQRIRAQGNEVPFVFLSRQSGGEVVQKGLDLGAEDFITKPASPEVVALKVNRVLDAARRAPKKAGVSGSLTEMALPDVVQILFHGRKSGKLSIESEGRRGEILFNDGMIFDAHFGDASQENAFYEMLRIREGDFELDPNFRPTEQRIQMTPESLLLEGMRRLDEVER
jgi:response regulator RpfG family c-di-GMP phosphodiesterase